MKEKYETLKGKVTLLYNENGCRAFNVKCTLGNFKVVDYSISPLDREIYWDNETHNQLNIASEEFKVASALTDGYIRGVHAKLTKEAKKTWPLV